MEKAKTDAKGHEETTVLQIPMVCAAVEVYWPTMVWTSMTQGPRPQLERSCISCLIWTFTVHYNKKHEEVVPFNGPDALEGIRPCDGTRFGRHPAWWMTAPIAWATAWRRSFHECLGCFLKKQKKVYTNVLSTFCMHHSFSVTIFTPSAFAFF